MLIERSPKCMNQSNFRLIISNAINASPGLAGDYSSPTLSTARKASCGISTLPMRFIRFFPSFCFSSSLRLRLISPPYHLAMTFLRKALTVDRAITFEPIAA